MFNHVLCPTDLSDESFAALRVAIKHIPSGAKVTLLTVIAVPVTAVTDPSGFSPSFSFEDPEQMVRATKEKLSALSKGVLPRHTVSIEAFTSLQSVGKEICDYASGHLCDVIIMGSHGAGALTNLLIGSTVQSVIKLSSVPVFVIPRECRGQNNN